ncbi:MAG: hypothetical protein U0176_15745 [Bacteroidia bacterium]
MKRVIKSYEKMDAALQALFLQQYPEGVSAGSILTFQDHTGKRFKGVEIIYEDTMYLIKLDDMLRATFTESDEKEETDEDFEREESPESDGDDDYSEDSFDGIDD